MHRDKDNQEQWQTQCVLAPAETISVLSLKRVMIVEVKLALD